MFQNLEPLVRQWRVRNILLRALTEAKAPQQQKEHTFVGYFARRGDGPSSQDRRALSRGGRRETDLL
jgi:hypothetical protein